MSAQSEGGLQTPPAAREAWPACRGGGLAGPAERASPGEKKLALVCLGHVGRALCGQGGESTAAEGWGLCAGLEAVLTLGLTVASICTMVFFKSRR